MPGKAVISLSTGLEDPEKVTVAFLVAVGGHHLQLLTCSARAAAGGPCLGYILVASEKPR